MIIIVDSVGEGYASKAFLWFQLDKQQFEETIQTLNNLYAEAEKLGGKSYLEGCLACLTAYTILLCIETHYEKVKLLPCCVVYIISSYFCPWWVGQILISLYI